MSRTYDDWKPDDDNPDYWNHDDHDPRDDPVVAFQERVSRFVSESEEFVRLTNSDRFLIYGELPGLHLAHTNLGLILSQYPNILPKQAAE